MAGWLRFEHQGTVAFGQLQGDEILPFTGTPFGEYAPGGARLLRAEVTLLTPCVPGKLIGLWNNFRERAEVEKLRQPEHPLYFVKTDNSYLADGQTIRQPEGYDGAVVFEAELGVVIGRRCRNIRPEDADAFILGYTCVNDVTARGVLRADRSFPQWTRAKSYDTFGPFGPAIVTGIDPDALIVRALVDGEALQNYPVADMFFRPREIVSRLSRDMTLNPGDLIACGTSVGAGPMPPGCTVEVVIEGVGRLVNRFE